MVPAFVMVVVANGFALVAVPAFAEIAADRPHALASAVGTSAAISAGAALIVGVFAALACAWLLPHVSAFDAPQRAQVTRFLLELTPYTGLVGAAVMLRAACEVRRQFVPAGLAPAVRGVVAITTIAALRPWLGSDALPIGLTFGQAAEVVWHTSVLARDGLRLGLGPLDSRVRQAMIDVGAVLGGEVLVAANLVVDKGFAATLPPGSVSWLEYADRARFIPQTLAESTLFPVAFAAWSALAASGDREGFAKSVDRSLRWMISLVAPPLAGMFIARLVLIRVLYERGAFHLEDALNAASVLGWYIPGLLPMFVGSLAMKANVIERRMPLVFVLGAVSALGNAGLDAVLVRSFGLIGVAIASTALWFVVPALYLLALWPTLRAVATVRTWAAALAVVAASTAIAGGIEWSHGTCASAMDPWLWGGMVACLGVSLAAWWLRSAPCAS